MTVGGLRNRLGRFWRWIPRRQKIAAVLAALFLVLWLVVLPIIAAPLTYNTVAPQGWRNVTVPGSYQTILNYAVSSDVPGLILSYGDQLARSAFGGQWHLAMWRSEDGGSHWHTIHGPCKDMTEPLGICRLAVPQGGQGTFFAGVEKNSYATPAQVWVTHNAGNTWSEVTTYTSSPSENDYFAALMRGVYRGDSLYILRAPTGNYEDGPLDFSRSDDDGATWTAAETTPSALERQGWHVIAFAPDYSDQQAWYRVLVRVLGNNIVPPMLEHSTDDGRSWQLVGQIGHAGTNLGVFLGTSPAQPSRLCVATEGTEGHIYGLSSPDGGRTFAVATTPTGFYPTDGYIPTPPRMGSDGTCYLAQVTTVKTSSGSQDALWQQAPGATVLQPLPSLREFELQSSFSGYTFVYVPPVGALPPRIIVFTWGYEHPALSWASVLSLWSGGNDGNLLLWTPAR